jgi:hypothetical protein
MTKDPLTNHRRKIAAAERALIRARDEMRAAAKREGLPTAAIFSESKFVLRTTADRRVSDAKNEAILDTVKVFEDLRKKIAYPASSPFAHLAATSDTNQALTVSGRLALVVDNTGCSAADTAQLEKERP